ncbi:MAG: phospho-sugar mutase [Phycisphaerales bacterium]|nr:phospho-sugar mutase [Phycisphaerales bacterium]
MEASIKAAVQAWLTDSAIADRDKHEIRELVDSANEPELIDRFYRHLEFGTSGMRGVIGSGFNRINLYTIGAAAEGIARYLCDLNGPTAKEGIAIAYDSRRMSDAFAVRVAEVMAAHGIVTHLFDELRSVPELSFAIRHLGCIAGIVITASHNTADYNGLKVYGADGSQVTPPVDRQMMERVRSIKAFSEISFMNIEEAKAGGLIKTIGRDVDEAFLEEVQKTCLNPDVCSARGRDLKIVYTPLHGAGRKLVRQALIRRGFEKVIELPEQAEPDGNFPTVTAPDPEKPSSLELAIRLAIKRDADLVLATDPDADRLGAAVRKSGEEFFVLTGNQIGALMTYYICEQRRRLGRFPEHAVMFSTIVSGDLMKDIARDYGAEVIETLSGFKWIARKLGELERACDVRVPGRSFLFAAEDTCSFMPGDFVRDKDGITSAAIVAEAAAFATDEYGGLYAMLQHITARYGQYYEASGSTVLPGREGAARMAAYMESFRKEAPRTIAGRQVMRIGDLMSGEVQEIETGGVVYRYDLPPSNVVILRLEDGTKAFIRPSGTEPKIKFYVMAKEPSKSAGVSSDSASKRVLSVLAALQEQVA